MKSKVKYELPIFSSSLEKDPLIRTKDMDMEIELLGADKDGRLKTIIITRTAFYL